MEHETEHIERPPLSDPDLPGFFLGVLDDAHPGNALRDIDGDVAGYRTRLTKGIVNALILCGVRPWVHDAAAVMNPILGELWRDGWWRDALTGRHVCVLSRGQSIFTDYQRWTRNGTRHPSNAVQEGYVNELQKLKLLDSTNFPFGETAAEFERQFRDRLTPELHVRVDRGDVQISRIEDWWRRVEELRSEATSRAGKLVPLGRVLLRLDDNTDRTLYEQFPELADLIIRESDGAYLDAFAAKQNMCAIMPADSGPIPALFLREECLCRQGEEEVWWPEPFAEERIEKLGHYSLDDILLARDSTGVAVAAGHAFDRISRGNGTAADEEIFRYHVHHVAGRLAMPCDLAKKRPRHWKEIVENLLAQPDASIARRFIQPLMRDRPLLFGNEGFVVGSTVTEETRDASRRFSFAEMHADIAGQRAMQNTQSWSKQREHFLAALNALKSVAVSRRGSQGVTWRK